MENMDVFGDERPDWNEPKDDRDVFDDKFPSITSLSFSDDEAEEGVTTSTTRLSVCTVSNGADSNEGEGGRM
jgi:hypothetical protein